MNIADMAGWDYVKSSDIAHRMSGITRKLFSPGYTIKDAVTEIRASEYNENDQSYMLVSLGVFISVAGRNERGETISESFERHNNRSELKDKLRGDFNGMDYP